MLKRNQIFSAAGTTVSWNLDNSIAPFNATVVCTLVGTGSYKLQWSMNALDGPLDTDASAVWNDSIDIPAGTTTSAYMSIITPMARIRLVIASLTGTLEMFMRQPFTIN